MNYELSAELLQAIVNLLNELPAKSSRFLLNAIEQETVKQDQQRAEQKAG